MLFELVENGVLPGRYRLDNFLGYCNVPVPKHDYATPGPSISGSFHSRFRQRTVGFTIAYPPFHRPGDTLPLLLVLHGYLGSRLNSGLGSSPARADAVKVDGRVLPPMALVTVDGGNGYWNPHPTDDPFGMVIHELIPMCWNRGLGRPRQGIAALGVSMGGYGALLMAEKQPKLFRAVAAISPAIWTSYGQARAANPGAYASAKAFAWADVVAHAPSLPDIPIRVAAGIDDPFLPGVQALKPELPRGARVIIASGCHGGPFAAQQLTPSLQFVSRYLGE